VRTQFDRTGDRHSGADPAAAAPVTRAGQLGRSARRLAAFEFVGLLAFQVFHQVEHSLEVVQKRLGAEDVSPLLAGVDFEWAHFGGNTLLFVGLVAVVFGYGRAGRMRWRQMSGVGWGALVVALVVQGSHVVEHTVRVVQYVSTGLHPAGLATLWIDPVWFHFAINLAFLAAMAVAFLALRIPRDLPRRPAVA
jgi:hypothetical protein